MRGSFGLVNHHLDLLLLWVCVNARMNCWEKESDLNVEYCAKPQSDSRSASLMGDEW